LEAEASQHALAGAQDAATNLHKTAAAAAAGSSKATVGWYGIITNTCL
jgi:hypothetical protein